MMLNAMMAVINFDFMMTSTPTPSVYTGCQVRRPQSLRRNLGKPHTFFSQLDCIMSQSLLKNCFGTNATRVVVCKVGPM